MNYTGWNVVGLTGQLACFWLAVISSGFQLVAR